MGWNENRAVKIRLFWAFGFLVFALGGWSLLNARQVAPGCATTIQSLQ